MYEVRIAFPNTHIAMEEVAAIIRRCPSAVLLDSRQLHRDEAREVTRFVADKTPPPPSLSTASPHSRRRTNSRVLAPNGGNKISDEEFIEIIDTIHRPLDEVADKLGRSPQAISRQRQIYQHGKRKDPRDVKP